MRICQSTFSRLVDYSRIPISFRVSSKLRVIDGVFELSEEHVSPSWCKDYDLVEPPTQLPNKWNLKNWAIFLAESDTETSAGCIIARDTPGIDLLDGRSDLAVIWDIRVTPKSRGRGIGTQLFNAAVSWAHSKGCTELQVETQDINVAACRFYEQMGCDLIGVDPNAYKDFPGETKFIWGRPIMR